MACAVPVNMTGVPARRRAGMGDQIPDRAVDLSKLVPGDRGAVSGDRAREPNRAAWDKAARMNPSIVSETSISSKVKPAGRLP